MIVDILIAWLFLGIFWYSLFFFKLSKISVFIIASLAFALFEGFQLSWFLHQIQPHLAFICLYFLLSLALGLQFGLLSVGMVFKPSLYRVFCLSLFWFWLEKSRLLWFSGFTWAPLGDLLTSSLIPVQLAAFIGVYGLSLYIVLAGGVLFLFFKEKKGRYLGLWAFLLVFAYGIGIFRMSYITGENPTEKTYNIALIQTAIPVSEKQKLPGLESHFIPYVTQWENIFKQCTSLTQHKLDLILFPENVVGAIWDGPICPLEEALEMAHRSGFSPPKNLFLKPPYAYPTPSENTLITSAFFCQLISEVCEACVIAGFYEKERKEKRYYNSAFIFYPDATYNCYRKNILLPIAEYLPLPVFLNLAKNFGIQGFFSKGKETIFEFLGKKGGVSLCYEETFTSLLRKKRKAGAEFFINLTNDYWYPESTLPEKHLSLSRLRSIENGVYTLRACNSGVTCIVDPLGRVKKFLEYDKSGFKVKAGILYESLSITSFETFYSKWGDVPFIILSCLLLIPFIRSLLEMYLFSKLFRRKKHT